MNPMLLFDWKQNWANRPVSTTQYIIGRDRDDDVVSVVRVLDAYICKNGLFFFMNRL